MNLSTATSSDESCAQVLRERVNKNPAQFELEFLLRCWVDIEFCKRVAPIVCPIINNDIRYKDFNDPVNAEVFYCIRQHNLTPGVTHCLTLQDLQVYAVQVPPFLAPFVLPHEMPVVYERFRELQQLYTQGHPTAHVEAAFAEYFESRAARAIANEENLSSEERKAKLRQLSQTFAGYGEDPQSDAFYPGAAFEENQEIEHLAIGHLGLNRLLGGGFAKGQTTLAFAPSSAGKTVTCCQWSGELALAGHKVLVIATETSDVAVFRRRIYSALGKVDYSKIVNGIKRNTLSSAEIANIEMLDKALSNHLKFSLWQGTGKTIESHLDATIVKYREAMGGIDFVALDWLNGDVVGGDPREELRLKLHRGPRLFRDAVEKYNVAGLLYAQTANPKTSRGNVIIDATDAAECKTMHQYVDNTLGISLIPDSKSSTTEESSLKAYQELQYFSVHKARYSEPGRVPFLRNFKFQRVEAAGY